GERGGLEGGGVGLETRETGASGLGPIFNADSCAACHARPTAGGSSPTFVTRFGRMKAGSFEPMTDLGGPIVQANGIVGDGCSVAGGGGPPQAADVTRRGTPPPLRPRLARAPPGP